MNSVGHLQEHFPASRCCLAMPALLNFFFEWASGAQLGRTDM
jgi:hypothetical protein